MWKKVIYTFYIFLSVIIISELALRIYNPFNFRVRGEHVILESNRKYVIDNAAIPVLDPTIFHTKNNLGFRGPDKPDHFDDRLSIVTIGGSTTECQYLDDEKTWTNILYRRLQTGYPRLWMNNAGIAGHSTFGHIAMIKEHIIPLKPDYVLMLVGANDIRRTKMQSPAKSFLVRLAENSELCNVIVNLMRAREARARNLTDTYIDIKHADSLTISDTTIADYLKNEVEWVSGYKNRLDTIISLCRSNNIKPILLTQPCLPGTGSDPISNVSLEKLKINALENGKLWWMMLEKYNEGTVQASKENNIPLIDLAHLLPKSSEYFYDLVHFTNKGAEKTAGILHDSLRVLLSHY